MLNCVKSSSSRKPNVHLSVPSRQAISNKGTPHSSSQPSPSVDVTLEYNNYLKSNSFGEIKSKIYSASLSNEQVEEHEEPNIDTQLLDPSQECVLEALQQAKPGKITCLASAYFEHSETTSLLCIYILNSIHRTRSLYNKIHNLLSILPLESDSNALTDTQCEVAFNLFIEISNLENPFPCPESNKFYSIRNSLSDLNQQLNYSVSRSSRFDLGHVTTCGAVCLVGATVGVTIAAFVIALHALPALVAAPLLPVCLLSRTAEDEVAHLALDAAARGTCFVHYDLNTTECLVERVYTAIEEDKNLIRLVLAGGCDRHPVYLVAKELHRDNNNIKRKLEDLEENVCLCIAAINKTRLKLLEEINHNQSHRS